MWSPDPELEGALFLCALGELCDLVTTKFTEDTEDTENLVQWSRNQEAIRETRERNRGWRGWARIFGSEDWDEKGRTCNSFIW